MQNKTFKDLEAFMKIILLFFIILCSSIYSQQVGSTTETPKMFEKIFVASNGDILAQEGYYYDALFYYTEELGTWTKLPDSIDIEYSTIFENRKGDLLLLNIVGCKLSQDRGKTWEDHYFPPIECPCPHGSSQFFASGDTILGNRGVISYDGGYNWQYLNLELAQKGNFILAKDKIFYLESNDDIYDYYIYNAQDSSLAPTGNYAYKRNSEYYRDEILPSIPDSVRLPFSVNSDSTPDIGYNLDNNENLILYDGAYQGEQLIGSILARFIDNKWEIIDYRINGWYPYIYTIIDNIAYDGPENIFYKLDYDTKYSPEKILSGISCRQFSVVNNTIYGLGSDRIHLFKYDISKDSLQYIPSIISVKPEFPDLPSNFELKQNYPNPFNPTTDISFSLPKSSYVKLTIYNNLGQQIRELENSRLTAGTHVYRFDATGLSSGIYLYKIETPDYRETRKMLLIK